ncbi:hypothetical protein JCM11641_007232 [Rhodosporidiobolus odoratus]
MSTAPFPDPIQALSLSPADLSAYFTALAQPSNYSLSTTPSSRARLKIALYSIALDPNSPYKHLFLNPEANPASASVSDTWSLLSAQAAEAPLGTSAGDEYAPSRRGKPCGHVFKPGESVYRCRDCGVDPTCVLCAKCFHVSSHSSEGHDVTVSTHAGAGAGCCDCGDHEAWKEGRQRDCRYHGTEGEAGQSKDKGKGRAEDNGENEELKERAKQRVRLTLEAALDWALDVFERAPETFAPPKSVDEILGLVPPSAPPALGLPQSIGAALSPTTPPALQAAIRQALQTAQLRLAAADAEPAAWIGGAGLTVVPADDGDEEEAPEADEDDPLPPPPTIQVQLADELERRLFAPRHLDADLASSESSAASSPPLPPPSSSSSASDVPTLPGSYPSTPAPAPAPAPVPNPGPFAIHLWNDEKHSFAQVIEQVTRAVGCSRHAASQVAQRVDTVGRDVVLVSPDAEEVLRAAQKIAEIELAVTVRTAPESWDEQVAAEIVSFARDLSKARFAGEAGGLAEVVARVWLEQGEGGSRWMRFAGVESRLWKAIRKELQEGSVGLMGVGSQVRAELGLQYATIYTSLAQTYLLSDREPENSLLFFGVQVFTVPSLTSQLVSASPSFLSSSIALLYSFFTGQLDLGKRCLVLPPIVTPGEKVDLEGAITLRAPSVAKRYFQLFSDFSHLISSPAAQKALVSRPELLLEFAQFLSLFSDMDPQHRAAGSHVEFESESWVTAFNVTIQVAKLVRVFGEAYSQAETEELDAAVKTMLPLISPAAEQQIQLHRVSLGYGKGTASFPVVQFSVAFQPSGVSYHHPLAWLWAEIAKYATSYGREDTDGTGDDAGRARFDRRAFLALGATSMEGVEGLLAAVEAPLRTLALVAQVRSGVWVRNGFGIRAQNLHYKDYTLRENTYDQDVFFLQASLVMLEPSLVVASLIDRFDLVDWLNRRSIPQEFSHPVYGPEQVIAMTSELLALLLTLVTDPTWVVPLSSTATLRRELIHYLALGPSVYSDLLRRLSDRFSDDPNIDRLLAQVARFKPPSGSNDQGTYSLRDEFFAEVEPYFNRYTRNQRAEAEKLVKEWMKRNNKGERAKGCDDLLILPSRLAVSDQSSGPFVNLPSALASRALHLTIFQSLLAAISRGDRLFSEQVVDDALQLALVAYVEQPEAFLAFAIEQNDKEGMLVELLMSVEEDETLAPVHVKAKWLLDRLVDAHGEFVSRMRESALPMEKHGREAAEAEAEAKRAAAKARQAAIMKQFQQAQSAFLQNVDDDDEDEEDEVEGEAKMEDAAEKERPRTNFGSCIVCQDELEASASFGMLAHMQGSNLLRHAPTGESNVPYQQEVLSLPASLDRDLQHVRPYGTASQKLPVGGFTSTDSTDGLARGFPQNQKSGIHASSCGHMMHLACFERYTRSLEQKHHQQPTRCHPEDLERREFTCPLCKSLGNVLLPAKVDSPAFLPFQGSFDTRSLAEWSKPEADPLDDSNGAPLSRFGEDLFHRVDKLTLLSDLDSTSSYKPWRATMALPMLLPGHFNESEGRMTARLLQVVTALHTEIGGPGNAHTATLAKDVIGYTISALEVASRGTAEPAWQLSDSNAKLLQSVVGVMHGLAELMAQNTESQRIAAVSVKQRMGGIFALGSKFEGVEFTTLDPLGAVIEAGVCMPSAFYHVVAGAFYSALAQAFLGVYKVFHQSASLPDWKGTCPSPEASEYLDLEGVRAFFPPSCSPALFDPGRVDFRLTLGKHLHAHMLVFLRRVAIVVRVVLGEPSEEKTDVFMDDEERTEFSRLFEYLRIPALKDVLQTSSPSADPDILILRAHLDACRTSIASTVLYSVPSPAGLNPPTALALEPAVDRLLNSSVPDLEHPVIYELLGLPDQLDTLIAVSLERQCKRCETVPSTPALCLSCGELLCSQSFCCMAGEEEAAHGECNEHMWTCGGSVGVYYLIKRNAILYLHTDKGTFSTPPYLDSHGEVDVGGRRTRSQFPQYLHRGRYDELRKLWLTGSIPTFVARKLENVTDHGGWTTF